MLHEMSCWLLGLASAIGFLVLVLSPFIILGGICFGATLLAEKYTPVAFAGRILGIVLSIVCGLIVILILIFGPHELGCYVTHNGFWAIFEKLGK